MSAQHTPGPWFAAGQYIRKSTSGAGSFAFARVIERDFLEDGDTDANARLIAAAPELLNALKVLVSESKGEFNDEHMGVALDIAAAAIAKATGIAE